MTQEIPEEAIGQVASIVYYWDSDGPDKSEDWNEYLKDAYIAAYTAYLKSKGAEILYPTNSQVGRQGTNHEP